MNLQKSVGVGAAVVSSVFGLFDRGINFLINGSTSSTTKKAPFAAFSHSFFEILTSRDTIVRLP
jgi:hypothetical protein